jgi:transcriptional regulator with XRE-family HTH domain
MSDPIKSDIDLYVAFRIRDLRKAIKMSQLTLATEIGVSHSFIGQVEDPKHKSRYNLIHLNRIAKILKCSPKDFLPDNPI